MSTNGIAASLVLGVSAAVLTTGCGAVIQDTDEEAAFSVNDTGRALVVTLSSGEEVHVPAGRTRGTIGVAGCKHTQVTATWTDGTVVVRLDQELCDNDTWTITDVGDARLDRLATGEARSAAWSGGDLGAA